MPCRPDRRFTPVESQHNRSRPTQSTVWIVTRDQGVQHETKLAKMV
jgi:hypothetical protein